MVNKQRFTSWLGLIIVVVHIGMAVYLFLVLQPNADRLVAAGEIILPTTTAYALTVVAWFISNKGIITGTDQIGWFLVVVSILVVGSFLASLPVGAYLYLENRMGPEALNQYYTIVESAFGGMFVLIFNFMFEKQMT
jgi:hypothetical protein